jgi:HEAT repeat protein
MAPLIRELQAAGFSIETLDELRESRTVYRGAIALLLRWLPRIESLDAKESIIRTLSVPWAKSIATRAVLDEFYKVRQEGEGKYLRWAVGSAMGVIADESVAPEIVNIVADPAHGTARQMFVLALGKLRYRESIPTLIRLLSDEDVAGHAAMALGQMGAAEALAELERLTTSGKPWVRKVASKAVKRITSAKGRGRRDGPP